MRQREYFDRGGGDLRRQIDKRIEMEFGHREGFDKKSFPDCKRESIYWMMDSMCAHYGVPYLEHWVVGCVRREILASTAYGGVGMAHEFQRGGHVVPVDNPPVDCWLFLFREGIDWAAHDDQRVFAVVAHVADHDSSYRAMLPIYVLTKGSGGPIGERSLGRVGLMLVAISTGLLLSAWRTSLYDRGDQRTVEDLERI